MDAFLNVTLKIQAYGDRSVSNNPRLKYVDWSRDASGTAVSDPKSEGHAIEPGATKLIFDGTRTTTIASNTAFDVTLSPLNPSRYRFTWNGGTNPTLRTDRGLTFTGRTLTFALLANDSVEVTVGGAGAGNFTGVLVGDTVFIPHTTTGDAANVLSASNAGSWLVIGVLSTTKVTLARFPNQTFEAVGESQILASNAQFQAFSSAGVQISDKVDITAGFSLVTRNTFEIVSVTSKFFEIISTTPLPADSGILPGTAGMIFYTDAKSFLYIESDQLVSVRCNGSVDNSQKIYPLEAGNVDRPGTYLKRGPAWALSIVNLTPMTANVLVVHAE